MNPKTDDKRLPMHRVLALIKGLPHCVVTPGELRAAILEAVDWFEDHERAVAMSNLPNQPSDAEYRQGAKSAAKVARKLIKIIDNSVASLLDLPDDEVELKSLLEKLTSQSDAILVAVWPKITASTGVNGLLRWLVSIYEQATGEPAKMPWTDRITGEVRGPLLDFIQLATADAFADQPLSPNAIKKRLVRLFGTGRRAEKVYRGDPVQSACGTNISAVTLKLRGDDDAAQAKRRRRSSLVGADRGCV
jgi:hypothetical protein